MNRIMQYLPDIFAFDDGNFDPSLPLQLNQYRHYDPTPGLWLNEEPVCYAGNDENLRKYVGRVSPSQNNPISDDTDLPTGP